MTTTVIHNEETKVAEGGDLTLPCTIDHYEVRSHLASGGMGAIYVAYEAALEREVALKFLSPALSRDATTATRPTARPSMPVQKAPAPTVAAARSRRRHLLGSELPRSLLLPLPRNDPGFCLR